MRGSQTRSYGATSTPCSMTAPAPPASPSRTVFVAVGAALDQTPTFRIAAWWYGSFARRSLRFGSG
jgi:hypothetical protein